MMVTLVSSLVTPVPIARANSLLGLPEPGTMVDLSPAYDPILIKGLKVHPENPFLFDFIIDTGNDSLPKSMSSPNALIGDPQQEQLKIESSKLIKYFLTALTVPEKDLWVNLSPYEKNRMIASNLAQTEMGRDMLAQDYFLKQLTASLIYPEKNLGRKFWDEVYSKAREIYGTTQIPVNTFNKVWVVADKADVYEHGNVAYVVGAHLKVMLEEDYLALGKDTRTRGHVPENVSSRSSYRTLAVARTLPSDIGLNLKAPQGNNQSTNTVASNIVRNIILPKIEKEVNEAKNFAPLRQMFYSIILASWYKMALKNAILTQVYGNQSKVKVGINQADPKTNEEIFNRYLRAYKKGVFNFIKEDVDKTSGETISRKYFSGGTNFVLLAKSKEEGGVLFPIDDPAQMPPGDSLQNSGRLWDAAMTVFPVQAARENQDRALVAGKPSHYLKTVIHVKWPVEGSPAEVRISDIYDLDVPPELEDLISAKIKGGADIIGMTPASLKDKLEEANGENATLKLKRKKGIFRGVEDEKVVLSRNVLEILENNNFTLPPGLEKAEEKAIGSGNHIQLQYLNGEDVHTLDELENLGAIIFKRGVFFRIRFHDRGKFEGKKRDRELYIVPKNGESKHRYTPMGGRLRWLNQREKERYELEIGPMEPIEEGQQDELDMGFKMSGKNWPRLLELVLSGEGYESDGDREIQEETLDEFKLLNGIGEKDAFEKEFGKQKGGEVFDWLQQGSYWIKVSESKGCLKPTQEAYAEAKENIRQKYPDLSEKIWPILEKSHIPSSWLARGPGSSNMAMTVKSQELLLTKPLLEQHPINDPGGIDFNSGHMQIDEKIIGDGVEMHIDHAMIKRIKAEDFDGLEFNIQSIVPVNLPVLLGLE